MKEAIEVEATLRLALEVLEEIALAGMSGTGQESKEGMTEWHARQAWKFISIAARALGPIRDVLAQQSPQRSEDNEERRDDSNEQVEPVAWAESHEDGNINWGVETVISDDPSWLDNPLPLYTHPPVPIATLTQQGLLTAQPKEHEKTDVRCECCGYMTYHREHLGCIRAARTEQNPQRSEDINLSCKSTQARLAASWGYVKAEPQSAWVGLTPKERDEINEQVYGAVPHYVAFHAAIEAKLKEKNT